MRGSARLGVLALGFAVAAWTSAADAREAGQPDPEVASVLQAAPVRVLTVLDGDTLDVQDRHQRRWRIRLQGIDAPELPQTRHRSGGTCRTLPQPHGEAARQVLADKVQGQTVHLRTDGTRSYDRVVAYVLLGRREVNLDMVAEGWAWSLDRHHASAAERQAYVRAQGEARAAQRGLWAESREGRAPLHPARWRAQQGRC